MENSLIYLLIPFTVFLFIGVPIAFSLGLASAVYVLLSGRPVPFSMIITETVSGVDISLRIVFAAIVGGMYSLLGPTLGTALTTALSEYLRVALGVRFIGLAETIYGLLLILFIVFLPDGIWGGMARLGRRLRRTPASPAR